MNPTPQATIFVPRSLPSQLDVELSLLGSVDHKNDAGIYVPREDDAWETTLFGISRRKPKSSATVAGLSAVLKQFYMPAIQQAYNSSPFWKAWAFSDEGPVREEDKKRIWVMEWLTRTLSFFGPMSRPHMAKHIRKHKPGFTIIEAQQQAKALDFFFDGIFRLPPGHPALEEAA